MTPGNQGVGSASFSSVADIPTRELGRHGARFALPFRLEIRFFAPYNSPFSVAIVAGFTPSATSSPLVIQFVRHDCRRRTDAEGGMLQGFPTHESREHERRRPDLVRARASEASSSRRPFRPQLGCHLID
jgi:hypothetical protein